MGTLRDLTEELHSLVNTPSMGVVAIAKEIQTFAALLKLTKAGIHQLDSRNYSADELRTLNTFVIGVQRARTMSPNTARGYIAAMWRGGASGIVPRIPFGPAIERNLKAFLQGGPQG